MNSTKMNLTWASHKIDFYMKDTSGNVGSSSVTANWIAYVIENAQIFNNNSLIGETETFKINATIDISLRPTNTYLVYNNIKYLSSYSQDANLDYIFSRSIPTPTISSTQNFTFYWEFNLDNGNITNSSNHYNQSISVLTIDDCSANTVTILNYTLYDEISQTMLTSNNSNSSIDITLDIFSLGSTSTLLNFSSNFSVINPVRLCLNINLTGTSHYTLDAQTRYKTETHVTEYHHLQNFSLRNSTIPQHIALYDLNASDSTEFFINFKDDGFLPVENALIDITRKYVGEGVFKTVEIPKTDGYGNAIGHFDLIDGIYTIIVKKYGEVLATFNNVIVICQNPSLETCKINLRQPTSSSAFSEWETLEGITYNTNYNKDTRIVTTTFTSSDGSSKTVDLNITKYDRFGNHTICSDTLSSSSGTLSCTIPESFGNLTIVSKLYVDGDYLTTRTFTVGFDASDIFGTEGYVLVLILMMTIPLMFITSSIGLLIGIGVGVITAGALVMMQGGGFIGTASVFLWIIIAGGILVWKIASKE